MLKETVPLPPSRKEGWARSAGDGRGLGEGSGGWEDTLGIALLKSPRNPLIDTGWSWSGGQVLGK